ncbi:MAG TPA: M56 family metallopeptidase, partial [Isosphaeraceae bacterium]|nr:M56 family metallopeptidase [Isosphaeraceae bacterium]
MIPHLVDAFLAPALAGLGDWSIRWAVLIAVLAAWFGLRPPRRAATRHLLGIVVLLAGLLLPALPRWGPGFLPRSRIVPTPAAVRVTDAAPPARPDVNTEPTIVEKARTAAAAEAIVRPPVIEPPVLPRSEPAPLGLWRFVWIGLAATWLVGLLVMLFRLVFGWLVLRRLRRQAMAVSETSTRQLEACQAEMGSRRRSRLMTHPAVGSPLALGGWQPAVLVPSDWDALPESIRRAGLLHELAHLARWDDWVRLGQALVRASLWFHPLVHWLLNRIDRECELVCDEAAVQRGVAPHEFARLLLEFAKRPRILPFAPQAIPFFSKRTIKVRINRLLEDDMTRWATPLSRGRAVALVSSLLGLALGVGSLRVVGASALVLPQGGRVEPMADNPQAEAILRLKPEPEVAVADIAFSPDGQIVATAGYRWKYQAVGQTGELRLWNARTGKLIRSITVPDVGMNKVVFSPDGHQVAAAGGGKLVMLWDVASGQIVRTFEVTPSLPEYLSSLAFSPDGTLLAAGGSHGPLLYGQGGYVQLWDVATVQSRGVLERGTTGVLAIAFSSDGKILI